MRLKTQSQKISSRVGRVNWHIGQNNRGILDIHLDRAPQDIALAAELIAIKHLIFDKTNFWA